MRSSQHAPYVLGYTRATMANTTSCKFARVSQSLKISLSSDCSLKLGYMKLESLVIVGQIYDGEYVLGPCTHRPSHHGSWSYLKWFLLLLEITKVGLVTGVKS